MRTPSETELRDAISKATRKAVSQLFGEHPGNYYYVSLITTGEAHAPFLAAWSEEALNEATTDLAERAELRWSYADSPYCDYGAEYFAEVREMFERRPQMVPGRATGAWRSEYELRLRAMEAAMRTVDDEGIFGLAANRNRIVVNVEVMPPDSSNTERARRLNPPEALIEWLAEVAEDEDEPYDENPVL